MEMSNTYFKINKKADCDEYVLSLTAFCGNDQTGNVQLTVQTKSREMPSHAGTGYITLNDHEIDLLMAGLLERKLGIISATGDEQSIFSPNDEIKSR